MANCVCSPSSGLRWRARVPAASGRRATRSRSADQRIRHARPLVASCRCLRSRAPRRSHGLARSRPGASGGGRAHTLGLSMILEREPEALLDLGASLEQAGSDSPRAQVSAWPTRAIAAARRAGSPTARPSPAPPGVRERRRAHWHASRWMMLGEPGSGGAGVVARRLRQGLVRELDLAVESALNVEASAKRTSARSTPEEPPQELLEQRDRPLALAGEAVEVRRLAGAAFAPGPDRPGSARQPARRARPLRQSPRVPLLAQRPSREGGGEGIGTVDG